MNNKDKAKEIANYRESEFGEIGDINYCCYMSALDMAQWKDEQIRQLHDIIIKLWDMLDWIDTYADLRIDGSKSDYYFGKIEDKTRERFAFVKSDGYDLFINEQKITNHEHNTTKTDC